MYVLSTSTYILDLYCSTQHNTLHALQVGTLCSHSLDPSSSHFTSTPNTPVLHSMQPSHSHTPTHFTLTPYPHSTPSHITPSLTMRESHVLLCDVLQFIPAPPLDPGEGVSHPQHWVTPLSAKGNSIALYREGERGKKGGRGSRGMMVMRRI